MGGWQTGNFGDGWHEWNDRYRDRVRNFWLSDVDYARRASTAPVGIGGFATRLAGSSNTFSVERGPLASVNFVTAHDGFTLRDLVSYDVKHNVGNGEQNRDGADTNRSFNHGAEGPTDDEGILATRRKAMRNLLGTLLLSAGVPMLTAGDEFARTQRGNNNAYCHDSAAHLAVVGARAVAGGPVRARAAPHPAAAREPRAAPDPLRASSTSAPRRPRSWTGTTRTARRCRSTGGPTRRTARCSTSRHPRPSARRSTASCSWSTATSGRSTSRCPTIDGVSRFVSLWSSADETPERRRRRSSAPGDVVAARRNVDAICSAPSDAARSGAPCACRPGGRRGRFETWSRRRAPRAPAPGAAPLHPGPATADAQPERDDGDRAASRSRCPRRRCRAGCSGPRRSPARSCRSATTAFREGHDLIGVHVRLFSPSGDESLHRLSPLERRLRPLGDRGRAARAGRVDASASRRSPTTSRRGSTPPT